MTRNDNGSITTPRHTLVFDADQPAEHAGAPLHGRRTTEASLRRDEKPAAVTEPATPRALDREARR